MVDAALVAYVTFNVPYKQRSADSRSCQVGLTASTHRCEVGSVDPSVCQLLFANVVMLFWIIMPFILIAVPAALLAVASAEPALLPCREYWACVLGSSETELSAAEWKPTLPRLATDGLGDTAAEGGASPIQRAPSMANLQPHPLLP